MSKPEKKGRKSGIDTSFSGYADGAFDDAPDSAGVAMPQGAMGAGSVPSAMPEGSMENGGGVHRMPASGMTGDGMTGGAMPGARMEGSGSPGRGGRARMEAPPMYVGGGTSPGDGMPGGMGDEGGGGQERVLIELRVPQARAGVRTLDMAAGLDLPGLQLDADYDPIPMSTPAGPGARTLGADAEAEQTVIVRASIAPDQIAELESRPEVVKVWKDTVIAPFATVFPDTLEEEATGVAPMQGFAPCPFGTCDCTPGTPKGTIADVAAYLGVNQIWSAGFRGDGITVGVVDGGITAQGRSIGSGDTGNPSWPNKLIPRVAGGFPAADWGTTGVDWGWHGNMCATDVLGMAPNARVYDIRISAGSLAGTISAALAGFQWAIDRHRVDGTPQVLTNSWGIFQEAWDPAYARDPNHPFTRKVLDALDEGILVLFAAGNCGAVCPDGRCGGDSGPGRDIWGANGHPRVMTVGAVNRLEQYVGYSSAGPAALAPQKPDFCSVTHFTGFFNSDSGTSAATPIAAGVVALLKQARPGLTQDQVKDALKTTAKDIGAGGWDPYAGAGIIRARAAFDATSSIPSSSGPVAAWAANRLDVFAVGTNSALYHKWWNGSAWGPSLTGYEAMGGVIQGSPEIVSWGANRLDAFVVGTNSALYHKWWNGSAWGPSLTGYENMGGTILGHPRAVSWGPNRLDVFVVGTNSALHHKWWNGSAWGPSLTGYENMGGTILGSPEVVSWGANRLDVFVVGTDSALYHKWWNGSAWGPSLTGYEYMGGTIQGQPRVVSWGPNRLDVFVVGMDSALYHKWWNGTAWGPSLTGWEKMGGTIQGSPEAVAWGPNRLDVFVVGTDSALYHKWWNGSAWGPSLTGYENMGGTIVGQPRAVAWGPNRLDVFVVGTNSALYHKWWNGSAWGPSLTGYEAQGGTIIGF